MTDLTEYEFELNGVSFGLSNAIRVESVDVVGATTRDADSDAHGDYRRFGRDFRSPGSWRFKLNTRGETSDDALYSLAQIEAAWDDPETRGQVAAVTALRYRLGSRTRVIFGRPRNFVATPTSSLRVGYIGITCEFERVDLLHYDDSEDATGLTLGASVVGGYKTPWKTPLRSLQSASARVNEVAVGGTAPTWAVVRLEGAQTNPWVEIADWRCQLMMTLNYDDKVVIDPRPWAQTVTLNGSLPIPGRLSSRTRLTRMLLPANSVSQARFGADATGGQATATVTRRNASKSL